MAVVPFRVSAAAAVLAQLEEAVALAGRQGRRAEALAAARALDRGLTWYADELGESRYRLPVFGELRVAIIGPLGVVFAVHAGRREVNVGRFRLLGVRRRPGSG
ncbi:MAG: hypothetical protein C0501_20485 [Isosphaera sp.]|nr:hypothetical protein [Isosphaera sp.]